MEGAADDPVEGAADGPETDKAPSAKCPGQTRLERRLSPRHSNPPAGNSRNHAQRLVMTHPASEHCTDFEKLVKEHHR